MILASLTTGAGVMNQVEATMILASLLTWLNTAGTKAALGITGAHPTRAPRAAVPPFLVVTIVGESENATLNAPRGLTRSWVQIDAWGASPVAAETTARLVFAALDGHRLVMAGLAVQAHFQARRDDDALEVDLYRCAQDFILTWEDAA